MPPKALWFSLGVVGVSLSSAVDAQQLKVAVGIGYETEDRQAACLSRSFLQIAPAYQRGRLTVTAPVQVSFRGTGLKPTASEPLGFKSDDWVDLGATGIYQWGKTQLEWEHHSHQLLSSGILPRAGYGDVERDDRILARVPLWGNLAEAKGAREGGSEGARPVPAPRGLRAVGGYWRMDRWTEEEHGRVGGPALGVEGVLPLGERFSARGQLLAGQDLGESRAFGEALAMLRYRNGSWFVDAQWKLRRIGGDAPPTLFAKSERTLSVSIGTYLH